MLKVGVEEEGVETYKLNLKPLIQSDADKLIAQLKQNLLPKPFVRFSYLFNPLCIILLSKREIQL